MSAIATAYAADGRRHLRRGGLPLEIATGDLTRETSDAIVNPIGAGLVDLAVRRVAGPALVEAVRAARRLGLRSISFPSIGTGVYRYPVHEAADVAVAAVLSELDERSRSPLVRFVLQSPATFAAFSDAARAKLSGGLDPAPRLEGARA